MIDAKAARRCGLIGIYSRLLAASSIQIRRFRRRIRSHVQNFGCWSARFSARFARKADSRGRSDDGAGVVRIPCKNALRLNRGGHRRGERIGERSQAIQARRARAVVADYRRSGASGRHGRPADWDARRRSRANPNRASGRETESRYAQSTCFARTPESSFPAASGPNEAWAKMRDIHVLATSTRRARCCQMLARGEGYCCDGSAAG